MKSMLKRLSLKKALVFLVIMVLIATSYSIITPVTEVGASIIPEESTFFATSFIEEADNYNTASDGDLWPSAWSDDDDLYLANGDGKGFDLNGAWADIVFNKITSGHPESRNISGSRISANMGQVWANPALYNRKPTGVVSVGGTLYMAVQDLKKGTNAFDDAPNATILKSTNKGATWTYDTQNPMFSNYNFTSIYFLDFGKDGVDNVPDSSVDDYIYAYGTDYNWRDSFNDTVTDPTRLYLARILKTDDLQDINDWHFYTGNLSGSSSWSAGGAIGNKLPTLQSDRRVYPSVTPGFPDNISNMTEISQGSVTYNKGLERYIYCSWTEYTFEFFEAPNPWGPWKRFLSKDFGSYPWSDTKNGGYTTVIPSKYISEDGNKMWVNANTFMGGIANYKFSLRPLFVTPYTGESANNARNSTNNLAVTGSAKTPITKGSFHQGNPWALNDGVLDVNADSWNGEAKTQDYWGYTWDKVYNLNKVVYTTGASFGDGGWFTNIKVQVRRNFVWYDAGGSCSPAYPNNSTANPYHTYTFTFSDTTGDGVRIVGTPGGTEKFTTIAELKVYYE